MAMSHFEIGICESSMTVPTVAVKFLRQAAQPYDPRRAWFFVTGLDLIFLSFVMLTVQADWFASGPAPSFKQLSRFILVGVLLCKFDQI